MQAPSSRRNGFFYAEISTTGQEMCKKMHILHQKLQAVHLLNNLVEFLTYNIHIFTYFDSSEALAPTRATSLLLLEGVNTYQEQKNRSKSWKSLQSKMKSFKKIIILFDFAARLNFWFKAFNFLHISEQKHCRRRGRSYDRRQMVGSNL